jgi:hypothetical protein
MCEPHSDLQDTKSKEASMAYFIVSSGGSTCVEFTADNKRLGTVDIGDIEIGSTIITCDGIGTFENAFEECVALSERLGDMLAKHLAGIMGRLATGYGLAVYTSM